MWELITLLDLAHRELNTKTGQSQRSIFASNWENSNFSNICEKTIGDLYSRQACHWWEIDREDCISSIKRFIEEDGGSKKNSPEFWFYIAWLNNDLEHPEISKLARYVVKNKLFDYSPDMLVSDFLEKSEKKPANRPKKNLMACLDSLMAYFGTSSLNSASKLLNTDRSTVREDLMRLVGDSADYTVLIETDFIFHDKIKELYINWNLKRYNNQ